MHGFESSPMPVFDPTTPLSDIPLVFVDVETTGLYPAYGDRIVELGALKVLDDEEIDAVSELVDPKRPISPGASAVNGITDEMVQGKPTFDRLAPLFLEFVEEAILVAHNAPFDLGFLSAELQLARAPLLRNQVIDTLQVARRYLQLPSNSLGSLAYHFGIPTPNAHRAMGDCQTTHALFNHLVDNILGEEDPTLGSLIDYFCGWGVEGEQTDPLTLLPPSLRGPVYRREPVEIVYMDASGNQTTRKILLKEVMAQRDYVYLVAYCYVREAERMFRLDRIVSWQPAELEGPF